MDVVWYLVCFFSSEVQCLWYSDTIYDHTPYDERDVEVSYIVLNEYIKYPHDVAKLYQ